jgi:hypothetical protein
MDKGMPKKDSEGAASQRAATAHLRDSLNEGREWVTALLEAVAMWTAPQDTYRGHRNIYFIAGEAFDWLLLAERLCRSVDGLVPEDELERLLFEGRFPTSFDRSRFKDLMGVDKYRGHLNYYYGVTVEEALQLATELEVHKSYASNGIQYRVDCSEEAFVKLYRSPLSELMAKFREENGYPSRRGINFGEAKELTYWLFKYRLETSDKAKIASDTKKGLLQLHRMGMRSQSGLQTARISIRPPA